MDVCVLRWPDQADEADRLASLGSPRLLLVEPGAPPPTETSCVVDWLRLRADDQDMRVRLAALSERAARHPSGPVVNDYGSSHIEERRHSFPASKNASRRSSLRILVTQLRPRSWSRVPGPKTEPTRPCACTFPDSDIASRHWASPSQTSDATVTSCTQPKRQTQSAAEPAKCRLGLRAISRHIDLIFNVRRTDGVQSGDGNLTFTRTA